MAGPIPRPSTIGHYVWMGLDADRFLVDPNAGAVYISGDTRAVYQCFQSGAGWFCILPAPPPIPPSGLLAPPGLPASMTGSPWIIPGWIATATYVGAVTGGYLYYIPIFVDRPHTYSRVGLYINGNVANAKMRIGCYTFLDNSNPGTLEYDLGMIDVSAAGEKQIIDLNMTLTEGYHYLCYVTTLAVQIKGTETDKCMLCPVSGKVNAPTNGWSGSVIPAVGGQAGLVAGGLPYNAPLPFNLLGNTGHVALWLRE